MKQTVQELLKAATSELQQAGVDDPHSDARRLLAHATGSQTFHGTDEIAPDHAAKFFKMIEARRMRKPVSQIIGRRAFWTLEFDVAPQVLDPRPETEVLVKQALTGQFTDVLDLGTGSGCIALCLLNENPSATAVAVDTSEEALEIAQKNAVDLGLRDRITLLSSNWFTHVDASFDLIVCNPPYVRLDEMPNLSEEIRLWEPMTALTAGPEGLEAYRIIAADIMDHLRPGGRALFEIGPDQAKAVAGIFAAVQLHDSKVHKDLDGRDRVVEFTRSRQAV